MRVCESFLSTLSLRRATVTPMVTPPSYKYFYPRSPCGERQPHPRMSNRPHNFYPRSPCGERLSPDTSSTQCRLFLSTLSLRRATCFGRIMSVSSGYFYPRSPCGERLIKISFPFRPSIFLSTLSLRRATNVIDHSAHPHKSFLSTLSLRRATLAGPSGPAFLYNFYPRSPCGERRQSSAKSTPEEAISIHALLAESDF